MRKFICTLALALTVVAFPKAQDFKFGKISMEELQEEKHPLEPDAEAAYLYKYRETYYNFIAGEIQIITEIHERIKIYNKNGFGFATEKVILNENNSSRERISGLKAVTYNLEGGKIVESKLGKNDVFEEQVNKYRKKESFTMPNVKEGSVIEYKYEIISPFFFSIDEFTFQSSIPIKKLEAKFRAPKYFLFRPTSKGYLSIMPKTESINDARFRDVVNLTSYDLTNVPSLKDEAYIDNINNYRSGISYELKSIQIPGSTYKSYSQTWDDVTKNIYQYPDFGNELKKTGYFEEDVDALLQGITDKGKKMSLIFDYVKSKMNWNSYYGYGCDGGVRKAYKDNTGNVAEINLMLTAMLRYAGINANPVLVSTKSHGIPLFPTSNGFNYVISAVEIQDGIILLDATDKYATPNVLPTRSLNWMGRLIRQEGSSSEIDLTPFVKAKEVVNMSVTIQPEGSALGKIRYQCTDHRALLFRSKYVNVTDDEYLETLENKYSGIEIDEYEIQNKTDVSKPVIETYSFSKDIAAEIIGDKMFLSPMMFFAAKENPFKLEKREFPVDFVYPQTDKYLINITVPDGYQVESLPESVAFLLPDDLGRFSYNIKSNGNLVQLIVSSEINTDIVSSIYYESLREYFNQIVQKQSEKLVLTKV